MENFVNLNESVKNLFETTADIKLKQQYTDQVWDILQEAYSSQGGIKGSGFRTKEDMLNIPFWKLDIVNGKVLCVIMYKYTPTETDKGNLRKLCALGIAFDADRNLGRLKLKNIIRQEFNRSIMEVSGLMESYIIKNFTSEYNKYKISIDEVRNILFDDDIISINKNEKYRYYRLIGNENYEKIMLGTKQKRF